jgi:hypothetical protein
MTVLPARRHRWVHERAAGIARAKKPVLVVAGVGVLASAPAIAVIGNGGKTRTPYVPAAHCSNSGLLPPRNGSPSGDFERAVWCARYVEHATRTSSRFIGGALPALAAPTR